MVMLLLTTINIATPVRIMLGRRVGLGMTRCAYEAIHRSCAGVRIHNALDRLLGFITRTGEGFALVFGAVQEDDSSAGDQCPQIVIAIDTE
jgi:hypothetical protein